MKIIKNSKFISVLLTFVLLLSSVSVVLASDVDCSVVDIITNTSSVTLEPGDTSDIKITCSVTGKQVNEASFQVNKDWTLSGGTFIGSNPQTITVPARPDANADATKFTINGTLTIAESQNEGAFNLTISVFDIVTSAPATLSARNSGNLNVTVENPAPPVISDTTAPELTLPSDITAEATGPDGAIVEFTAAATDDVDGDITVTCTPPSGSTFPLGSTTVNCSATDAAGNTATGSFTVTVVDTTPPVLTDVPADIIVEATSSAGAVVTFTNPTATDLVDGTVAVTCTPASGSTFPLGTTIVNCSATDSAGNTATDSFKVTVQYSWSGVLQPINVNGSSIFKLGSTVPVKFQLTGASAGITNATAKLTVTKVNNGVLGDETEAVSTAAATSGNLFRYDSTSGQYIFNLGTKGLTTGTYQLRIDLSDGSTNTVLISLK